MDEKTYTVYMHIAPNGKRYVGITGIDPEKRWKGGLSGYAENRHFYSAIKKYGWNNFEHKILATGLSKEDAEIAEIKCIKHWDLRNPDKGYNLARGGCSGFLGGHHTDEAKQKISKAGKGRIKSKEERERLSKALTGLKRSPEIRKYFSALRKENLTEAQRKALDNGRPRSRPVWCEETQLVYKSVHEIADALGINRANLKRHLDGKYKQCKGYHCRWATEEDYLEQQGA